MLGTLTRADARALEEFLREFDACRDELHGYFCPRDATIDQAVEDLEAWARGERLRAGWVPCSTYFWRERGALLGVINVRHMLTDALRNSGGHIGYSVAPTARRRGVATRMLRATLPHARALGITRAVLTCDAQNMASRLTIERNGGVCVREGNPKGLARVQRWYHIELSG